MWIQAFEMDRFEICDSKGNLDLLVLKVNEQIYKTNVDTSYKPKRGMYVSKLVLTIIICQSSLSFLTLWKAE